MSNNGHRSRTAALVFGAVGTLLSSAWAIGYGTTVPQAGQTPPLALVVVVSTVTAGVAGAIVWTRLVDRFDRWSIPVRGAVAGAATVWAAFALTVPVVVLVDRSAALSLSPTALLEALGLAVLVGTVGMVFVGVFLLPVGVLAGYFLGRRQAADPGPVPVVSSLRQR